MIQVKNKAHSFVSSLEEKYSDSQDNDDPLIQLFAYKQINNFSKSVKSKQSSPMQHYDLQQKDILISDNSIKAKEVIKLCNIENQADEENTKSASDFVSNLQL